MRLQIGHSPLELLSLVSYHCSSNFAMSTGTETDIRDLNAFVLGRTMIKILLAL